MFQRKSPKMLAEPTA